MEGESSKRRSVRQATTRKRSLYAEPETEDEFTISEDESASDQHLESIEPPAKKVKLHLKRPKKLEPRQTRSKAATLDSVKRSPLKSARCKPKHPSKPTKQVARVPPPITSDGIIPPWQTLPYEILAQIFSHAFAAELEIEKGTPASRRSHHPNTWIMRTSRKVCRAFAEPALSAFYEAPNLLAGRWLEDFLALISIPPEKTLFQYRMKVRRLEIGARHLGAASKDRPQLINEIIAHLPHLSELIITDPQDEAPFEPPHRVAKYKYPTNLFDSLDAAGTHLTGWRWNQNLYQNLLYIGKEVYIENITKVHLQPSFQTLRHLTFCNLTDLGDDFTNSDASLGVNLAGAIKSLPGLKSLAFQTCETLPSKMLMELPQTLDSLEFTNCPTLMSDTFYDMLARNGSSPALRKLILNHNPFLDLAFFTTLDVTCPHLEVLKMDLYDHRENYFRNFGQPKYEVLLVEDEIPSWPSTLQTLELVHLSKWGAEAAQNLFRSLVESAETLSNLRKLVLNAHINISWRDRAAFRDQWIERLRRVYLSPLTDPNPTLASLRTFREYKRSQQPQTVFEVTNDARPEHGRKLSHVEISRRASVDSPQTQTSDSEPLSKRRSKRISDQAFIVQMPTPPHEAEPVRPRAKGKGKGVRKRGRRESDAISVASETKEGEEGDWRNTPEKFIQGLCDVVDIVIDNQRPREEQLNESHFLDSEASGDEEWTEGAELDGDGYAW